MKKERVEKNERQKSENIKATNYEEKDRNKRREKQKENILVAK